MMLVRILRALFGVYAILIFLLTLILMAILIPPVFLVLPDERAPHTAHHLARFWAKLLHFFFILPLEVENKELIDPKRAYVFVANHRSQLDIPTFALASKNTFRFLAKAELEKIPLLGFLIRKMYITVKRTDRNDRNKSIEVMRQSLNKGISVFICPEGTRNRKNEPVLLDFRDGAFRLAVITQTPIAVLTVMNTGEHLSPNRPLELAPGKLYAAWDAPIETKGMSLEDVPALKARVRELMEARVRGWREAHS
ncbi:MAG: lysophospholipid acyltransferase family protein [Bacteroidia bacterium]